MRTDKFKRDFRDEKSVLNIVRFTTPIGPMFACASRKGVCLFDFTDRRMLETEFKDLRKRLNAVILPGEKPHLDHIQSEIQEYFAGKIKSFTVPLHTPGTDFQKSVWKILQEIPYKMQTSSLVIKKSSRVLMRRRIASKYFALKYRDCSYNDMLVQIYNLGGDTDTIGAMAGAIKAIGLVTKGDPSS